MDPLYPEAGGNFTECDPRVVECFLPRTEIGSISSKRSSICHFRCGLLARRAVDLIILSDPSLGDAEAMCRFFPSQLSSPVKVLVLKLSDH